ncbi:hypothetical protein JTB14_022388 [Gonioctena quinquepunctata]|nr:hypothetical protein JTB14_022388 [Gonioctena quinquepunctata]
MYALIIYDDHVYQVCPQKNIKVEGEVLLGKYYGYYYPAKIVAKSKHQDVLESVRRNLMKGKPFICISHEEKKLCDDHPGCHDDSITERVSVDDPFSDDDHDKDPTYLISDNLTDSGESVGEKSSKQLDAYLQPFIEASSNSTSSLGKIKNHQIDEYSQPSSETSSESILNDVETAEINNNDLEEYSETYFESVPISSENNFIVPTKNFQTSDANERARGRGTKKTNAFIAKSFIADYLNIWK